MNIWLLTVVINKIAAKKNIPCDIKNVITSYITNGYTVNDLIGIEKEKNKKRSQFMKLRIKLELVEWYKFGVPVKWLTHHGIGNGWYGRKSPRSVFGGGTKAESQHLRYHYNNPTIQDDISQGDRERNAVFESLDRSKRVELLELLNLHLN